MTRVTFEVHVVLDNDLKEISEEVLANDLENYREILLEQEVLEGSLLIEVQDQPRLEVTDELWAVVQNLCFACFPALLEEKRECYIYTCTSYDGHIVMLQLADLIRLIGEDTPTITEKKQKLLPELFDCGIRYLEFLKRLGDDRNESVQYLQPFADKARRILQQHQFS